MDCSSQGPQTHSTCCKHVQSVQTCSNTQIERWSWMGATAWCPPSEQIARQSKHLRGVPSFSTPIQQAQRLTSPPYRDLCICFKMFLRQIGIKLVQLPGVGGDAVKPGVKCSQLDQARLCHRFVESTRALNPYALASLPCTISCNGSNCHGASSAPFKKFQEIKQSTAKTKIRMCVPSFASLFSTFKIL